MLTTQRSALVAERPRLVPSVSPMDLYVCKDDELILYNKDTLESQGILIIGHINLIGDFHWAITNTNGTQITTKKHKIRCNRNLKLLIPNPYLTGVRHNKITIRIWAFVEQGYALERVGYIKHKKPELAKTLGLV